MPLPVVAIKFGTAILSKIALKLGIPTAIQAFKTGGFIGLAKFLVVKSGQLILAVFTITQAVSWFTQAANFIWNFNWNISDEEIESRINSALESLASVAGGTLGQTLGSITCSGLMVKLNPSVLLQLDEITDEIIDEIVAAWAGLFQATLRTAGKILFLKGFKTVRQFLLDSGIAAMLFGAEFSTRWGVKRGGVISFAKMWEDRIESIGPQWLENFVEEFFEEAIESCQEALFLVAGVADQNIANQRRRILGENVILEVQPNRDVEESTVIAGRAEIVRSQVVQVLAQNQLMGNRDVGVIIGGSSSTELSYERDPRLITVIFEYAPNNQRPFFKPVGGWNTTDKIARPKICVSNVKRTKLDWNTLKLAAGGSNGYMYGRHRMTYKLVSPGGSNRGEITVWAASRALAKDRCDAFLALTDSELKSANPGEEIEAGNRSTQRNNMKAIQQVYPYRCTILVGADSTGTRQGRKRLTSPEAQFVQRNASFSLIGDQPPTDFEGRIEALLRLMN